MVGGRLVVGSVVGGFNENQEKTCVGSDFACALWLRFILLF